MMMTALFLAQAATTVPASPPPPAAVDQGSGSIGYMTADELARRCDSSAPASVSYCYAFIAGVHDTMRAYEQWLNQREFCVPAGTPQSDLRRSFLTYLSAYPASRSGQASSVVVVSLKDTYPCPAAGSTKAP